MKDIYKSKGQHLEELPELRYRTNELEKIKTENTQTEEAQPNTRDIAIPKKLIQKWQSLVDIMAKIISVPAALIRKVDPPYIEVFRSSESSNNQYKVGDREHLAGLYCENVIKKRDKLLVPNALKDKHWNKNPDIKLGMISYLGFPLLWPDGDAFGTICVLDSKENRYSKSHEKLMIQFKELVEAHLGLLYENRKIEITITELKLSEEELREKEEFNFALFQHNPIQTIVVDREGRVIKINMAKRKSGDRVPNIGDVMYKDYAGSHEIDMRSELMECIRSGETKTFPGLKYDDKYLNISIASFPRGAIITSQDITEQKRAKKEKERLQAQLIHAEKMAGIGTLASGIAHEFNNLLHIMRGHAEFAQSTKKAEDMEEALDVVLKTSDEVAKIIGDLLAFAREEPSKKEKESGDITESIELVLSLMEEYLRKQNIEVVRKYGKTPQVEMNKGEMQQVFLNIVNNARDAMLPKGGKLEIETKRLNENIEVSISDTGNGIEKENLGKLFEPFYTTKRTEEDDSEFAGTGLGLSVSYGIVKRHGGKIEVKSKMNKGTTFTVKLPLKK